MSNHGEQARLASAHRIQAIEDATTALAAGIGMVATPGWQARTGQPALQMIATGVEKLAKMTLATMRETDTGSFPDQKDMRAFGHNVGALVRTLATHTDQRATREQTYVLGLQRGLAADPCWPPLVEALDTAASATAGRYVHESALGGTAPKGRLVHAIWQELDDIAIAELGLLAALAGPGSRSALVKVRTRELATVVRWWHLVLRVWQHGLAGPIGRQFASEISLQWVRLPDELSALARAL